MFWVVLKCIYYKEMKLTFTRFFLTGRVRGFHENRFMVCSKLHRNYKSQLMPFD